MHHRVVFDREYSVTGSIDTSTGGKLRAVFLAFVMVVSVFGATIAFSGSAAATDNDGLSSIDGGSSHPNIETDQNSDIEQVDIQFTTESGGQDAEQIDVDLSNIQSATGVSINSISNLTISIS
jgi:surface glycoprotein (TIGR04207 family)